MESPADPVTVQADLQRIETLVALHKELEVRHLLFRLLVTSYILIISCEITLKNRHLVFKPRNAHTKCS